tara:strand:- start:43 stop:519 length:477 start_codon:yes stop_codon:yes gene_type:complete
MGTTTFSGPIKAGSIKDTTGTTVGTDVNNVGTVLLTQSARVDVVGATAATVIATLPAGSQITNVYLNVFEAVSACAAATFVIGTSTADASFLGSTDVTSVTNVRSSAMASASINVGATDQQVIGTFFPASAANLGTLGDAVATVEYRQPASAGGFYTI